ncbi:MAG: hypothetical protein E7326_07020 [Clostridiales bacterium]|nr:hypothetical protein [Clostridiales bacterium]
MRRMRFASAVVAVVLMMSNCAFAAVQYNKLQRGDFGTDVRTMQQALKELGYSLTVDGKFGSGTERVVKQFQKDQKLTQDGVAGQMTLSRLYDMADDGQDAPQENTLKRGSKGAQVLQLQKDLNKLGYSLSADGDFGAKTESAVRAFQLINGLPVTGQADGDTLSLIASLKAGNATQAPTAKPAATQSPSQQTYKKLQRGSYGDDVRKLQQALKTLGYAITVDGSYGYATQTVVKNFQRDQKLSADGIAGAITQKKLYSLLANGQSATPKPAATATAKPTQGALNGNAAQVVTGGGYLNLRDETKKDILGHIPNYAYVTVVEKGSVWCRVIYQGQTGYAMTSFLTFPKDAATAKPTQTPAPTASVGGDTARVLTQNGGALNLRETASQGAKIKKSIPNKSLVTVTQYGSTWCAVVYEGQAGFVMTKFLTDFSGNVKDEATPTAKPTILPVATATATAQPTAAATASPTPKPSYDTSVFQRTLKSGHSGNDVKQLQQRLKELNYLTSSQVDGSFGDSTLTAVKTFQKLNGLSVDGKAGKQTFEKLFSASAIAYSKEMEGYSDLHIYYEKADADLVDDIKNMQTRLMQLGYTTAVTGKFDANTYLAVINFQLRNNLTVDGVAGAAMQSILYSDKAKGMSSAPSYQLEEGAGYMQAPDTAKIKLLHWQREIKDTLKSGQTMLIYDPVSKLSWNLSVYAPGRHCDSEPKSLRDTLIMFRAFGKPSWDIHAVYVLLPSGQWTMATMHNYPHLKGNITDNGFDGHVCVHFLRDMAEAKLNDPNYGVNNQNALRDAWKQLTGETVQ